MHEFDNLLWQLIFRFAADDDFLLEHEVREVSIKVIYIQLCLLMWQESIYHEPYCWKSRYDELYINVLRTSQILESSLYTALYKQDITGDTHMTSHRRLFLSSLLTEEACNSIIEG